MKIRWNGELRQVGRGNTLSLIENEEETYEPAQRRLFHGEVDPVVAGETVMDGDIWFDPSEAPAATRAAGDVTFSDSGLTVITGISNVQAALAAVDAALVQKVDGPFLSKQQFLSDVTTTGGTSFVQWGSSGQKVTFDQTLYSGQVIVQAWLVGYFADVDINEFVDARLAISWDGGSSWANGLTTTESRGGSFPSVSTDQRDSVATMLLSSGTPTGEIQVKAECRTLTGSNQANFHGGLIMANCRPKHASE